MPVGRRSAENEKLATKLNEAPATGAYPWKISMSISYRFSQTRTGSWPRKGIRKNTTESHNGSIEVRSKVGQGSTFTLKLPFVTLHPGRISPKTGLFSQGTDRFFINL
jgi:hypothetical protein